MNDDKHRNITVCFWVGQAEILEGAAKARGMSLPDYFRKRLVQVAAKDAGLANPEFPDFARRGYSTNVRLAAKYLEMPTDEFKQRMAEKAAEVILAERAKRPSGFPPSNDLPHLESRQVSGRRGH